MLRIILESNSPQKLAHKEMDAYVHKELDREITRITMSGPTQVAYREPISTFILKS